MAPLFWRGAGDKNGGFMKSRKNGQINAWSPVGSHRKQKCLRKSDYRYFGLFMWSLYRGDTAVLLRALFATSATTKNLSSKKLLFKYEMLNIYRTHCPNTFLTCSILHPACQNLITSLNISTILRTIPKFETNCTSIAEACGFRVSF